MSLYLGTTLISGVATGDAAVQENLDSELATQDNLISQIMTALEGKSAGGSEVIVGTLTTTTSKPSIIIQDAIGKDNVGLMFVTSGSYQANAMADAGLGNVIVNGSSHAYNILYADSMYADFDDGFIKYDKTTGTISINNNMRYNETFVKGTYVYVTW